MSVINLCMNCLDTGPWRELVIGYGFGSQRDPSYHRVTVCDDCKEALERGDFGVLRSRYKQSRNIDQSELLTVVEKGSDG